MGPRDLFADIAFDHTRQIALELADQRGPSILSRLTQMGATPAVKRLRWVVPFANR